MELLLFASALSFLGYNINNKQPISNLPNATKMLKKTNKAISNTSIEKFQNIYNNETDEKECEDFHNNMQPFFGSNVTQNTSSNLFSTKLSNFTGNYSDGEYKPKKEINNMFNPVQTGGNVFGTHTSDLTDRYVEPTSKNNDKLFTSKQVGPGLGLNYNETPSGGYQQLDAQMYALPRSIDTLRVKTNPQKSYTEPTIPGTVRNPNNRGKKFNNTKHKKVGFIVDRQQLPTSGANNREIYKSKIILPDNNRKTTHTERFNSAGNSTRQIIVKGKYRDSSRNILKNVDSSRNFSNTKIGGTNRTGYKKPNITSREINSTKGDNVFRNMIGKSVNTLKNILFKPRQTIKETTGQDFKLLNPTGKLKLKRRTTQNMRKTTKETTVKNQYYGGSNLRKKINYNSRKHIIPNTHRQTTDREYTGNAEYTNGDAYKLVDKTFIPHTTNKQITSANEYIGHTGTSGNYNTRDRADVKNMNQNLCKEEISKGRIPKGSNKKKSISKKDINVEINRNNLNTSKYNHSLPKKINTLLGSNNTHITSIKDSLADESQCQHFERLNPEINLQLNTNPYNIDIVKTKTI